MSDIVTVDGLNVIFGKFYAVKDVSFSVQQGEIFGFLGANGAGKTTTIRVLCGLLVPTSGQVVIDSEKCIAGRESVIKQKVGYMSQKFTLYNDLTIDENLRFTASLRQIPKDIYNKRKKQLFEFIEFDKDPSIIVDDLPGGTKQEIALVSSLLHDPKLVFLDEPTAGVAPVARARFWDLIKKLALSGKTIFVTTHYMDEAENCNRIALMRSGELIALDSPLALKKKTYSEQMYHITVNNNEGYNLLASKAKDYFSVFEAYGRHFHVVIKKELDEKNVADEISRFCEVKKIDPSLEDVFVRLVEGGTR